MPNNDAKPDQLLGMQTLLQEGQMLEAAGEADKLAEIDGKIIALDAHHILNLARHVRKKRSPARPMTSTLHRIMGAPVSSGLDIGIAIWAGLLLDLPEKAFSFSSNHFNVLPYADLEAIHARHDIALELDALLPPIRGTWPESGDSPIVFAAGSSDYVATYARDLAESVVAKSSDARFHLHVMNPDGYEIERALAAFPAARVTYTYEEDRSACEKIAYSTRRFLRLSQFTRKVNSLFTIVDIDSIFNGDAASIASLMASQDVGLYLRDDAIVTQMVSAGVMAIAPSNGGRAFIDFVAAYIFHFEAQKKSRWFLDQMALISAYTWFKKQRPDVHIRSLPRATIDWMEQHDPATLIWTQKGGVKRRIQPA